MGQSLRRFHAVHIPVFPHKAFRQKGQIKNLDLDIEELQLTSFCNKPKSLGELEKITKFNKRELKIMYRGFKQECPSGILDMNKFIQIYKSFFPLGNAEPYAFHVHRTILRRCDGPITFDKLMTVLSLLTYGSASEKLEWVFELYDIEKNGYISRKDVTDVVYSIYQLLGERITPPVMRSTIIEHVDSIFQKLNINANEPISVEEFKSAYLNDSQFLVNTQALLTHF